MSRLRLLTRACGVALALVLWAAVAQAQPAPTGGASASGSDTAPTLSYSATSGRLLFALVTVNDTAGTTTCTAPSGWTEVHADEPIFSNYVLCAATKIATGSDAYTWTLSVSAAWALGVVEVENVSSATAVNYVLADQNTTTPAVTSGSLTAGALVLAGLIDTYDATLTAPSGFTALTLSPASGLHYGTGFSAMGSLAWKLAAGGAETPTWGQTDSHFTGLGVYAFSAGGGSPTVPAAPTIGTACAGNTTASVAFTPGSDGGSAITGYTATSTPSSITGSGASSPVTVSGLTNGVSYTFTVHATNAIGDSTESSASNSVEPGTDPVPTSRLAVANWEVAGVTPNGGIPARPTICTSIAAATYGNGATDASAAIASAIAACPSGQTVSLGAGDFRTDSVIPIAVSNVTVRGAGAGVTTLTKTDGGTRPGGQPLAAWPQTQDAGDGEAIFRIGNTDFPHFQNTGVRTLTADATQGTFSVTVDDVTGLVAGQFVEISEDQFYDGGSWKTMPLSSGSANKWEAWGSDKIQYSRWRIAALPSGTVTSSNAGNEQVTLNSTTGLAVGDLLYITGHSWVTSPAYDNGQYMVATIPSSGIVTLNTYPNAVPVNITSGGTSGTFETGRAYTTFGVGPISATGSPLEWFNRGGGHLYGEIKEIASVVGSTVTFTTPFTDTYRMSHSAELAIADTAFITGVGVEGMTLERGDRGAIDIQAAAKSWVKDVEITEWGGHGINIAMSYQIEVTGSYVHYAAWPVPGGGGYAIALENQSTEVLITNSITADTNKNIVANSAGAGSVVSYNYFDDSFIWYDLDWQEVSANASHFGGPHHVLFEGNRAVNFDSDFTHGSAYSHTAARNLLVGTRDSFAGLKNGRILGLGIFQWNMSAVGNVLGETGITSPWTLFGTSFVDPNVPNVYKLGYDPGDFNAAAEATTVSTFIDGGNYNYFTPGIRTAAVGSVPSSYYLSAAPSFMGSCTWPWVTPEGATKTYTLPAYARYVAGQPNDTTTNRCAAAPTSGVRLRIRGDQ